MKILVTGGTGFVGGRLAGRLVADGHEVWVTGRDGESGVPRGAVLTTADEARLYCFDACMHQAANNDTLDGDERGMMEANVFGPARMFQSLAARGCRRFVYASSTAVYGNMQAPYSESTIPQPLNVYAVSKLAFDEFAAGFASETGSAVFGLRYCNVYGPGEAHKGRRASMVMHLARQMASGERPRIFRHGEQRRDWVYVDDVVEANLACLSATGGGVFNVAGGRGVSFNELVAIINSALGTGLEPEYTECPFAGSYQGNTECDISKARDLLGWSPRFTLEAGVGEYLPLLRASL